MPDGKEGYAFYRVSAARKPLSGSNGDDRRQRRKQGGAVGAAASRMQATAKQTLGAATRAVSPKVTERASPSPDRLGRINLRPAGAEGVSGGFGLGFGAEHAEDRRAAAGHKGGDGPILPEGGLDSLVVLGPAALLEGVSGSGADSVQVASPSWRRSWRSR